MPIHYSSKQDAQHGPTSLVNSFGSHVVVCASPIASQVMEEPTQFGHQLAVFVACAQLPPYAKIFTLSSSRFMQLCTYQNAQHF